MRYFWINLLVFLGLISVRTTAQALSERRVSYAIQAELNPETQTITATQRMTWRNPDKVPVSELQFHLYLNAFKNEQSTFMKESGGEHRGFSSSDPNRWGQLEIERMQWMPNGMRNAKPIELMAALQFIRPDDGNPHDFTVAALRLPRPLQPNESIELHVRFKAKLPQIFARTGWERKPNGNLFFMVAQWFPKFGVYEIAGQRFIPPQASQGRWNTHQFHANSEFYADYGTYHVQMTVPQSYQIGATGAEVAARTANGKTTYTYQAEDVHDFAWTASQDFEVFTDTWKHVKIRALVQKEHAAQGQRHLEAAKTALSYFDQWYGTYPYKTLTLVDAIGGANGMEYPTLITCGTVYQLPAWFRTLEGVTIHEFGHQFWYGMVGSNEFEESWLDEGINSYTEMSIMEAAYGAGNFADFAGFPISDPEVQRLSYTKSQTPCTINTYSWQFLTKGAYGVCSYSKPATMLKTLENRLGLETMRKILRTYFDRWKFKHPTSADFMAVVEEVSNQDLDWFFDQYVNDDVQVDYSISALTEKSFTVTKKGEGWMPTTIQVHYANGEKKLLAWEGRDSERTFTFQEPIREVYLDPFNHNWLELNRLDNRKSLIQDASFTGKYWRKLIVWLQNIV